MDLLKDNTHNGGTYLMYNNRSKAIIAAVMAASVLFTGCSLASGDNGGKEDEKSSASSAVSQVSAPDTDEKSDTITIRGNVIDESDNILEGFTVKLEGAVKDTSVTDSNGFYSFTIDKDKAGEYKLSVSKDGYDDYSETITVGDSNVTKGIFLVRDKNYFGDLQIETGTLTDADVKSSWKTVTSIKDVDYPIYSTGNADLKKYLEGLLSKETMLESIGKAPYETIYGSFEYSTPIEGYLQMRTVLSGYSKGMPHPQSGSSCYFVDLAEKKNLTLCDLFKEKDSDVKKEIAAKAYKYMDSALKKSEVKSLNAGSIYDGIVFYVTDDNLTIEFAPYAIASYAAGYIKCTIPWKDISLHCVIDGIETAAKGEYVESSAEASSKAENSKPESGKEESSKSESSKEESKSESGKEETQPESSAEEKSAASDSSKA